MLTGQFPRLQMPVAEGAAFNDSAIGEEEDLAGMIPPRHPVTCDRMAPLLVTVTCTGTGGVTSAYWIQPLCAHHTAEFRCCTKLLLSS